MTKLFVDTLFVVALINPRDQYHDCASALAERFEQFPLIMTDCILLEIGNALARNFKSEAVTIINAFQEAEEVEIVNLSPELFARGYSLFKQYQDKQWGLVDCISFVVMQEAGIDQALTFDKHFVQAGFQALMRDD